MGRNIYPPTASVQGIDIVVPVDKGGVGGTDEMSTAQALSAIPNSQIDVPGGLLAVGANGKISESALPLSSISVVTIKGAREAVVGQTVTYDISNFDSKTTYVVAVTAGTVSVSGSVITFTAPGTVQNVNLTINDRIVTIPIVAARPKAPTVTALTIGTTTTVTAVLSGSAYQALSGSATHTQSDWEIATDVTFTSLFASAYGTTNLTAISFKNLSTNTQYYARARYKDSAGNYGSWSQVYSFVTKPSYSLNTQIAKLTASDAAVNDWLGNEIDMNTDGTLVVVGAHGADVSGTANAGAAYIMRRDGLSWVQEAKLVPAELTTNGYFGFSVAMTDSGNRVAIGCYGYSSAAGAVYIFIRSGTTWTQEARLQPLDAASGAAFGIDVSFNTDGTRLAVGAYAANNGANSAAGATYTYTRSGSTWTQEAKITQPTPAANDYFGRIVLMSPDGLRLFITANGRVVSGFVNAGMVYCYVRSGSTWSLESYFQSPTPALTEQYGWVLSTTLNGDKLTIGCNNRTVGGRTNCGAVDYYTRTNSTWTLNATIVPADSTAAQQFGVSANMTSDGTVMVVGSHKDNVDGLTTCGSLYTFKLINGVWVQDTKVTAGDKVAGLEFGYSSAISSDGAFMVGATMRATISANTLAGAAYVFANR